MAAILYKRDNQRNSSIELLRIISMVMIVSCHFATHGGFSFDTNVLTIPRLWWNFIEMGGNFGVNVFVLISGYFLIESKSDVFDFKKILKFWSQLFTYTLGMYLFYCLIGISDFGLVSLIKTFFPITFGPWWFASTYFVLYLIHPFLNMLLRKLDKKTYKALVVTFLTLWCVIPTLTTSPYQSNNMIWFITLYCVSGYVRLFGLNPKFSTKHYFLFWLFFSALRYLSCVVLMVIGLKIPSVSGYSLYLYDTQSILTFLSALSLFMAFEKWNMGYNKWINIIASASFGVYLIHDHKISRSFLWHTVFKNAQYQNSIFIIPYSVIVVAIIYIACTLIDLLRKNTIEKPILKFINAHSEKLIKPFANIIDYIKDIVFGEEK